MQVKDILPKLKANRYTFRNLSESDINYFRNNYNYLKRNEEREVNWFVKISINDYLNNKSKIETINFVSTNLI
jgi:uridine kinase